MRGLLVCCLVGLVAACSENLGTSVSTQTEPVVTNSFDVADTSTTTLEPGTTTSTPTTSSTTTTLANDSESIPIGPLAPRGGASVVWTGEEMIVWGGCDAEPCRTRFADGAAFDPDTGDWRKIAESALTGLWYHSAVWTGSEMLIAGGSTAAAYSPESNSWRPLPDPPFRVGFKLPDGSARRDYVGAVWAGDRYVIWDPRTDEVAAYRPETDSWVDLPSTGLDVDLGVLRWNGTDLVALGALTSAFPDRVPLQGARLVDADWEALPTAEPWDERHNIGANPYLSGWAGDVLVSWTDSGSDAGRTMTHNPGADAWTQIATIPLPGSEAWPEPVSIGDRLLAFQHVGAAIYDSTGGRWVNVNIPFAEAGRAVWTGDEVLFWGEVCCYGTGDPFQMEAWRYTPPSSR